MEQGERGGAKGALGRNILRETGGPGLSIRRIVELASFFSYAHTAPGSDVHSGCRSLERQRDNRRVRWEGGGRRVLVHAWLAPAQRVGGERRSGAGEGSPETRQSAGGEPWLWGKGPPAGPRLPAPTQSRLDMSMPGMLRLPAMRSSCGPSTPSPPAGPPPGPSLPSSPSSPSSSSHRLSPGQYTSRRSTQYLSRSLQGGTRRAG